MRRLTAVLLIVGSVSAHGADEITLNFKDADIAAVISSVAQITGKNFVVDPRVKGKVTVISSKPMNANQVYQTFLSILEVHGFSAIESGNVVKIKPDAEAKHSGIPNVGTPVPETDEIISHVIQLEHVSAAQLVPILRPLIPPQGHLAAHPQTNTLIVSDRARTISRLVQIIKRIDQPSTGELEIVPLQHASAVDLVKVINSLQQQGNQQRDPNQPGEISLVVADERTNSILISGERSVRLQMRAIISHLDTPTEVVGDTHVIYLRYAKAKDMVPVLTGVGESQQQAEGKAQGATTAAASSDNTFRVEADESTNALVITAPPAIFRSLESVIQKLDIRRAQVLVEAIIAEVTLDKTADLGIQWIFDGTPGGNGPVGVTNFTNAGPSIQSIAGAIATDTIPNLGEGVTLGLGVFDSNTVNFAAIIRALKGDGNTNVLSTPSLVTMDNEEAEIVVGQEVPFITGSFASTSSSVSNPFQTISREDVGITLKVKPQINAGNTVKLDIEQTVDSLAAVANAADLVTNKRSIKTSVIVDDGKILVLGGLIKDELTDSVQKVPLLGDIPIIGALFRSQSSQKTKTNLMVFLRPVILRSADDGLRITAGKYDYIRNKQLELQARGVPLMKNEGVPLMPQMNDLLDLPAPYETPSRNGAKAATVAPAVSQEQAQ